jgi:ATP-binding cassette subfamily F protein uup
MDRLCTEVIGLDGRGNSAPYATVSQWLTAYEQMTIESEKPVTQPKPKSPPTAVKPKKLSFNEQKEWEQIESTIMAAEETVARCEAEVARASAGDHTAMAAACQALEEAQREVERLYHRWQELEAKRAGTN